MLLHGREEDLERLSDVVDRAAVGEFAVVLLEGEAGIGKTTLCNALRQLARERDFTSLVARCSPLERTDAFSAVRQLLEPVVVAARGHDDGLLDGAAAYAATVLEPNSGAEGVLPEAESRALHGLHWLVANLTDRGPLLLVVDDAHWADVPSLRFLAYLLRRAEGLPLVIALAARPDPQPGAGELLDLISQDPAVVPMRPRALDEASVGALVEQLFDVAPEPAFVAAARHVTGGNPFYLRELLRAAADAGLSPRASAAAGLEALGPDRVARSVRLRIAEHGPLAEQLARVLAVLDGPAPLALAAAVLGRPGPDVAAVAELLIRADVLEPAERLAFVHRIVRTAVFDDLPVHDRVALHARAATALAEHAADPGRVAMHLLAMPPRSPVTGVDVPSLLLAAAAAAHARGAPDLAEAYLVRALAEDLDDASRGEVRLELARLRMMLVRPEAAADFAAALELVDDPARRSALAVELVQGLTANAQLEVAIAVARRELRSPGLSRTSRTVLEAELTAGLVLDLSTHAEGFARVDDLLERRAGGETLDPFELAALGFALVFSGRDTEEGTRLCLAAMADPVVSGTPSGLANGAIFALVRSDAQQHLEGLFAAVETMARETGSLSLRMFVGTIRGLLRHSQGDLLRAEEDVRSALQAAEGGIPDSSLPILLTPAALVLAGRGQAAEAAQLLADLAPPEPWPPLLMHAMLLHARATVALADGRAAEALADLGRLAVLTREAEIMPEALPWRSTAAAAHLALGDRPAGRALAEEELDLAREAGVPRAVGRAMAAAALCAETPTERAVQLQAALDVLEADGPSLDRLRVHAELGAALRRAGQRTEARAVLRDALDAALAAGASGPAELARAELVTAGARPRRERSSGPEALTASERRVVDLAAAGSTNREIAQALFLTTKTVETHLSSCFRKLDVSSRRDLAAVLAA